MWTGTAPLSLLMCAVPGLSDCTRKTETERLAAARAQLEARDHASAIVTLKDALQHNEGLADGRPLLGRAEQESGDGAAAFLEMRKAAVPTRRP
jgi:Tfp pilus assembly protein PilF